VAFDDFGSTGPEPRSSAASFAAIERMARQREVYVKFSAPFRFASGHPREVAAQWLDTVGPTHVLWGSDWPWTGHEAGRDYARLRAELDDWVDARVARAALWDNAARLYGFA
jgi:predicted TIM-barrel fold metal-dependent hydrolase